MFQDSLTKKIAEAAAQIKTEPEIIKVNEKSVEGAVEKIMNEKLIGNQHKIDANKNNKVDAHDFKLLRAQKEKEKANSMKYGKDVKEQVKPEVEKAFPATGVKKHAPIKGVNYMPKDKEKANSMKYGRQVKEEIEEIEEATPTSQQIKQGIGIARDKRYAKGNVTGAVKAMDKVNKGIAQHPVVNKELRKQNEETELTESHFKVGDKVKCKMSGMKGEVVKMDKEDGDEDEKYYTVKREDGQMKKMAPSDMTKINEATKEKEEKFHMNLDKLVHKTFGHSPAEKKEKKMKEETEQILEYESKGGVYKHKGTYGTEKSLEAGETDWEKEEKLAKKHLTPKPKKYGARQNYIRSKRVGGKMYESFSEIINSYKEGGLKTIAEMFIKEEPSQEEFTKEVEEVKKKASEKKSPEDEARVAKGKVDAVKVEEEVEELDEVSQKTAVSAYAKRVGREDDDTGNTKSMKTMDRIYKKHGQTGVMRAATAADKEHGIHSSDYTKKDFVGDYLASKGKHKDYSNKVYNKGTKGFAIGEEVELDERELSDTEMKKREEYVKGMKKKMPGFKERYGERAKEVMYATATKMAKED